MDLNLVQVIAIYAIPVIFAITLHEAAHGYVAMRFGDMTAYAAGRVSLNPMRHIDPVGTDRLAARAACAYEADRRRRVCCSAGRSRCRSISRNLRHPKQRHAVGGGGRAAEQSRDGAALGAGVEDRAVRRRATYLSLPLALMGAAGVFINVIFMVLNLLPLPPLDGGRILVSLLPHAAGVAVRAVEPYGFIILIVLLFTDVLGDILWPLIARRDVGYRGRVRRIRSADSIRLAQLADQSCMSIHVQRSRPFRHAAHRRAASRPLPRRAEELDQAAARIRVPVLRRRLACAHDALRRRRTSSSRTRWDMVIDWLAAGVDPAQATLFIQSQVPEHAELHLLLSMITPLGWLERVPTYKDQQEKLARQGPRPPTAFSAIRCCRPPTS